MMEQLREPVVIVLPSVLLISGLNRPWKLKFSGKLLCNYTEVASKADFENLPSGQFYSHFTDFHDF